VSGMDRAFIGYLEDILENAGNLKEFTAGLSFDAFVVDLKTQYAVTRALEIIGEAAKRVPTDFRDDHPAIPWRKMAGMRDVLAHQYEGINPMVLYRTATEDINAIIADLPAIIADAKGRGG
jgi:uncharacterized protein with HEPN domain